jgi:predicted metal-dependent peptidase
MLDAYSIFKESRNGKGNKGMQQAGHSSMEQAMSGQGSPGQGSPGQGSPGQEQGEGQGGESIEDKLQKEFNDTTGSDGHSWMEDIKSGKAQVPTESEQDFIDRKMKEAQEKGIQVDQEALKEQYDKMKEEREKNPAAVLNEMADSLEKYGEHILRDAVEKTMSSKGRGHVPGLYMEKYDELTKEVPLDWRTQFETLISDPKEAKETYRINKYNRNNTMLPSCSKYGFKEDDPKYHIWVSIDTSGSMGTEDILEGLSVVQGIQKSDSEIKVTRCDFDTKVQKVMELDADTEQELKAYGRGGTDFNAIFNYISDLPEDQQPDLHIVFTDGGAPPPSEEARIPTNKMPLLWVLTSSQFCDWFIDQSNPYGDVLKTDSAY